MTFDTMIANVNAIDALAVKVSFGNEIRRASFNDTSYAALLELATKLFELDQASAILKYQDDDGDKITMSTDGELQEAVQSAKAGKKILRLYVEVRPTEVPPAQAAPVAEDNQSFGSACPFWKRGPFPGAFQQRGGFRGHRGYLGHFGHHDRGLYGLNGLPYGPNGFPGHYGHHEHGNREYYGRHFGPASEAPTQPTHCGSTPEVPRSPFGHPHPHPHPHPHHGGHGPHSYFQAPGVFAHGTFSPADSTTLPSEREDRGPYAARCAFKDKKEQKHAKKEEKHAMKETIRDMKAKATTLEEWDAIKELKENMRAECKKWSLHVVRRNSEHNSERLVARHVADVTIPDNSELPADTPITKTWKIKNAGIAAWPADSQLVLLSRHGDDVNGPERVVVQGPVLPQQEIEVSITFLTPHEPGRYITYYRMATPEGLKFGQRVWVAFVVVPAPKEAAVGELSEATARLSTADDFAMD